LGILPGTFDNPQYSSRSATQEVVGTCPGRLAWAQPSQLRVSHAGTVALLGQGVDDRDVRVDLDGSAVEGSGAVAPLADGSKRGLEKERIAGNDFQRLDRAVHGDDGVKFHAAFAADLNGEGRIDGLDAVEEFALLDEAADSDEVSLRWNRRLCGPGGRGLDPAKGTPAPAPSPCV